MKQFNNSFAETLKTDLELFLDLISVYQKVNSPNKDEKELVSIEDVLVF